MKKFFVLGVGNAQVDLLKYLKERKYEVHACSYKTEGRGLNYTDYFQEINIVNVEAVLNYCVDNKIDYIYSVGSDIAMPVVSEVSERLGLNYLMSSGIAKTCNSKELFREKLKNIKGSVQFQTVSNPSDHVNIKLPAIVKPSDSQGQRGVKLVDNHDQLSKSINDALKFSRNNKVIIEEYIDGNEISINTFVDNGELVLFVISDRISWPHNGGGIIHKHFLPTKLSKKVRLKVFEMVKNIILVMGINNGPVYFQIKIMNDEPRLIEITPRLDGCHMWRVIKMATGVDLMDMTIKKLAENSSYNLQNSEMKNSWVLEFFCSPPNTIFKTDDFKLHNSNKYCEFYYTENGKVILMNGFLEKCGYQIYDQELK